MSCDRIRRLDRQEGKDLIELTEFPLWAAATNVRSHYFIWFVTDHEVKGPLMVFDFFDYATI